MIEVALLAGMRVIERSAFVAAPVGGTPPAHPVVGKLLTPDSPIVPGAAQEPPRPAPLLGRHTEEILGEVLGMSAAEIGRLFDWRVVDGA